jgi:hypothetical protein
MKELTGKFIRVTQTQWGPKIVFGSFNKPEWSPIDIGPNVDTKSLEAGQTYKIFLDQNEKGFSYLARIEKSEPQQRQWKGGGGRAYDPLNFVSNVVGQAIQAGLIKEASQVRMWAAVAWFVTKEPQEENRG